MSTKCIDIVRNKKNNIVAYTLEMDNTIKSFAPDVLREMIEMNRIYVLNLEVKNYKIKLLRKEEVESKIVNNKIQERFPTDRLIWKADKIAERIDSLTGTYHSSDIDEDKGIYNWMFIGKNNTPKFNMYIKDGRLKAQKIGTTKEFDMHTEYKIKTICYLTDTDIQL